MYRSGGRLLFKGGSLAKERAVGSGEEAALQLPGGGCTGAGSSQGKDLEAGVSQVPSNIKVWRLSRKELGEQRERQSQRGSTGLEEGALLRASHGARRWGPTVSTRGPASRSQQTLRGMCYQSGGTKGSERVSLNVFALLRTSLEGAVHDLALLSCVHCPGTSDALFANTPPTVPERGGPSCTWDTG